MQLINGESKREKQFQKLCKYSLHYLDCNILMGSQRKRNNFINYVSNAINWFIAFNLVNQWSDLGKVVCLYFHYTFQSLWLKIK